VPGRLPKRKFREERCQQIARRKFGTMIAISRGGGSIYEITLSQKQDRENPSGIVIPHRRRHDLHRQRAELAI